MPNQGKSFLWRTTSSIPEQGKNNVVTQHSEKLYTQKRQTVLSK